MPLWYWKIFLPICNTVVVLAIPLGLLLISYSLLPPFDYLPEGNRNQILWIAEPYPGTSIPEIIEMSSGLRSFLREQPEVTKNMLVIRTNRKVLGVYLKQESATARNIEEMVERMQAVSGNFPGYRVLVPRKRPIFQNPGKEFEIQLVGEDLEQLNMLQQQLRQELQELPGVQNARADFVTGAPELQVIPNRERLAEVGLSESEIGTAVEAALGGVTASEFVDGRRELDVIVELLDISVETPEQLRQLTIYTGAGQVQLSDIAEVVETTGAEAINHVDLERAITLTVSLGPEASLGGVIQQTQTQILAPLRQSLPTGVRVELAGSADVLSETLLQLGTIFLLSLLITYLLLVALYRSFIYPFLIMATVPIGITGALLSLVIANSIPGVVIPLDMITSLGFVILTGIVVNNAILLIDRALQLQKQGIGFDDSLYQAVRDRLRPIFMSAGTSVLGMLPLAILPGRGAELYQGLGIALTGGLALSTFLTPTVIPASMGLLQDMKFPKNIKMRT